MGGSHKKKNRKQRHPKGPTITSDDAESCKSPEQLLIESTNDLDDSISYGKSENEEIEMIQEARKDHDVMKSFPMGDDHEERSESLDTTNQEDGRDKIQNTSRHVDKLCDESEQVVERLLDNLGEFTTTIDKLTRISNRLRQDVTSSCNRSGVRTDVMNRRAQWDDSYNFTRSTRSGGGRSGERSWIRDDTYARLSRLLSKPSPDSITAPPDQKWSTYKSRFEENSDFYPNKYGRLRYRNGVSERVGIGGGLRYPSFGSNAYLHSQTFCEYREKYNRLERSLAALERRLDAIGLDCCYDAGRSGESCGGSWGKRMGDLVEGESFPDSLNDLDELDRTYYEKKMRTLEKRLEQNTKLDLERRTSMNRALVSEMTHI